VSQLVKFSAAAVLVLTGFFSASLLGPPEHLASNRQGAEDSASGRLVPLEGVPATSPGAPLSQVGDTPDGVTPAGFTNPQPQGFASSVRAAHYPESAVSDANWGTSATANDPGPLALPEVRRADSPVEPWNQPAPPTDRALANLAPAPQLGAFEHPTTSAPQQQIVPQPTTSAAVPSLGLPSAVPQPTFAHQPASESSPWTDRASAGQPAAPLPWSTASPTTEPQRAPTALHTPSAASTGGWDESRESRAIRWHVVSDGDSLPRLAQRYLNDPNRSNEIFEENRNVLNDPEVLPIGVQLRIPDATPAQSAVQVYDAQGTPLNGIQPRRLVELPEVSAAAAAAPPVARLRTPQFAGSTN
jgi:nucleoid-associated protein YgaU